MARLLKAHGLRMFDVEEWPTHGGSLRVFACHEGASHAETPAVARVLAGEREGGLFEPGGYAAFAQDVVAIKCAALQFLIAERAAGRTVCAYGAAAKGNTFLNYCGIGPELVRTVADRSPHKQGTLLPGSRIPVVSPEALLALRPDSVLILPWNLKGRSPRRWPRSGSGAGASSPRSRASPCSEPSCASKPCRSPAPSASSRNP